MSLFAELERLRLEAGQPSYRDIARSAGRKISASSVHNVLHYHKIPQRWEPVLLPIVRALHGNEQEFFRLWQVALLAETGTPPGLEDELRRALILEQAAGILREYGIPGDDQKTALRVLDEETTRLRS